MQRRTVIAKGLGESSAVSTGGRTVLASACGVLWVATKGTGACVAPTMDAGRVMTATDASALRGGEGEMVSH